MGYSRAKRHADNVRMEDVLEQLYTFLKEKQTGLGASSILVRNKTLLRLVKPVLNRPLSESALDLLEELEVQGKIRILQDYSFVYQGHRIAVVDCEPWPWIAKKT
jgi:hypothetical protein